MLTNLISRLFSAQKKESFQKEKAMTKLEKAKQSLRRLKAVKGFNPLKASSVNFNSSDDNIASFYERVNTYLALVQSNSLSPQACFCKIREVNLDKFFTDDGVYIQQRAMQALCELCEKLISTIEENAKKEDTSSLYSERLLSKVFTAIIELEAAISKAV